MATAAGLPAANDDHDDWVFPCNRKYKGYIVEFMSFVEGRTYDPFPEDTEFTKEQLLTILPSHVQTWLNFKAYEDPLSIQCCHSSYESWFIGQVQEWHQLLHAQHACGMG